MTKEVVSYRTQGTCCQLMQVEIEDNTILNAEFLGGCNGNLQGIKNLIIGMSINSVIERLKGIKCGSKSTSCPDQLAQFLEQYLTQKYNTTASQTSQK